MRPYIPIVNNNSWQVRFATLGNWDFGYDQSKQFPDSVLLRLYAKQRILLHIELKDAEGEERLILHAQDGEFPDVVWVCPQAVEGVSEIDVDVTEYCKAWNGGQKLQVKYESEDLTSDIPAFVMVDGIAPEMLTIKRSGITIFDAGGGFAEGVQFGSLPTCAHSGDIIEVIAPMRMTLYDNLTYAEYEERFEYLFECVPNMRMWEIGAFTGSGVRTVQVTSGAKKLQGFWLYWEPDEIDFNDYVRFDTGQVCRVTPIDSCREYKRVQWLSRCGSLLQSDWEAVQTKDDTTDEVIFDTLSGEYNGRKGVSSKVTLKKSHLSASDVWYYGSIVTSSAVKVRLFEGDEYMQCKVLTKSVQADVEDAGYYSLEVELEIYNYDAN